MYDIAPRSKFKNHTPNFHRCIVDIYNYKNLEIVWPVEFGLIIKISH